MSDNEAAYPQLLPIGTKIFSHQSAYTAGSATTTNFVFEWEGRRFDLPSGQRWRTTREGMEQLGKAKRFLVIGNSLRYKRYLHDFPVYPLTEVWRDTSVSGFSEPRRYVVQTNPKVISRCVLMTTDPGDLVLDSLRAAAEPAPTLPSNGAGVGSRSTPAASLSPSRANGCSRRHSPTTS